MNGKFEVQAIYDLLIEYDLEIDRDRQRPAGERASWVAIKIAGAFILLATIGVLSLLFFGPNAPLKMYVLLSVFMAWLAAMLGLAIPVLAALPDFKKGVSGLRYPVKGFLAPSASFAQRDHDFSVKLASYDKASLRFVATRMHTHAEGIRSRGGMVIGNIERAGFIPLSIVFSFAVWELLSKIKAGKDAPIDFPTLCLGSIGLVLLTVGSMIAVSASRRIDELAGIVELAIESNNSSDPVDLDSTPLQANLNP